MSTCNIVDFDGTINKNGKEVCENKFGKISDRPLREYILSCLDYLKGHELMQIVPEIKKELIYRKGLIDYLKKEDYVYIISDNPFVKELIPLELNPVGVYSTIIPEIVRGKFTGRILKESTKVDVMKKYLPEPNGNKINFYTDGGQSDEELIGYLLENYENVEVFGY